MLYQYNYKFIIPVNIIIILILLYLRLVRKKSYIYLIMFFVFTIYLQQAIKITLFPIHIGVFDNLKININDYINLKPLNFSTDYIKNRQVWGNILLTVPLGFALPWIFNIKNKLSIIICIAASSLFEFIQLLFIKFLNEISFTFDINDIIFNVLGSIFGYLLLYLFTKIILKIIKDKNNLSFFQDYIYRVCYNIQNGISSLNNL